MRAPVASPPDLATLIVRLRFAVEHPYAHGVVTLRTKTAATLLRHLESAALRTLNNRGAA